MDKKRHWVKASWSYRSAIRELFLTAGIEYTETKTGIGHSIFIIYVTDEHYARIARVIRSLG